MESVNVIQRTEVPYSRAVNETDMDRFMVYTTKIPSPIFLRPQPLINNAIYVDAYA